MRIIIHAGMHKTGSSSIQQTFSRQSMDEFYYPEWTNRNHSEMLALMFSEPVEERAFFKERGKTREQLLIERAERTDKLVAEMESGARKGILLSAESVSGSLSSSAQKIAEFFDHYCDDLRIIAYVRPPISFMQSAFQQRVRGGKARLLRLSGLWPDYRQRFEPLDKAFGRERVHLKKFTPNTLYKGDVIQDFAREIGVTLDPGNIVRANVGVSLEVLAFIFAERRQAPRQIVSGGSIRSSRRFMAALESIGDSKLIFANSVTAPVVERHRADLEWMEDRLGEPLLDTPTKGTVRQIASEEDLLAVAEENQDKIEKLLIDFIQAESEEPYGRLVRNLDLLRKVYY